MVIINHKCMWHLVHLPAPVTFNLSQVADSPNVARDASSGGRNCEASLGFGRNRSCVRFKVAHYLRAVGIDLNRHVHGKESLLDGKRIFAIELDGEELSSTSLTR